ncbi:hypothetical protein ABBQ32_012245 [Trebouxia sp. C0010 RCD-2024]
MQRPQAETPEKQVLPSKINTDSGIWYNAETAARHCGYKQPAIAISKHVPLDMCRLYGSLMKKDNLNQNQHNSRYISTQGVETFHFATAIVAGCCCSSASLFLAIIKHRYPQAIRVLG